MKHIFFRDRSVLENFHLLALFPLKQKDPFGIRAAYLRNGEQDLSFQFSFQPDFSTKKPPLVRFNRQENVH